MARNRALALVFALAGAGMLGCREQITEVPSSIAQIGVFGSAADYPGLSIAVDAGRVQEVFTLQEMLRHSTGFVSGNFLVPDRGTMAVHVELRDGETTVAEGGRSVELRPFFQWGIRLVRQSRDPHEGTRCDEPAVEIELAPGYERGPDDRIWLSVSGPVDGSACDLIPGGAPRTGR